MLVYICLHTILTPTNPSYLRSGEKPWGHMGARPTGKSSHGLQGPNLPAVRTADRRLQGNLHSWRWVPVSTKIWICYVTYVPSFRFLTSDFSRTARKSVRGFSCHTSTDSTLFTRHKNLELISIAMKRWIEGSGSHSTGFTWRWRSTRSSHPQKPCESWSQPLVELPGNLSKKIYRHLGCGITDHHPKDNQEFLLKIQEQSRKLQVHGKDIHKFGRVPSLKGNSPACTGMTHM